METRSSNNNNALVKGNITKDVSISDLLVDVAEMFKYVILAEFLQHFTGVGVSEAVNPYTVLFIHTTLYVIRAGLFNSRNIQQM